MLTLFLLASSGLNTVEDRRPLRQRTLSGEDSNSPLLMGSASFPQMFPCFFSSLGKVLFACSAIHAGLHRRFFYSAMIGVTPWSFFSFFSPASKDTRCALLPSWRKRTNDSTPVRKGFSHFSPLPLRAGRTRRPPNSLRIEYTGNLSTAGPHGKDDAFSKRAFGGSPPGIAQVFALSLPHKPILPFLRGSAPTLLSLRRRKGDRSCDARLLSLLLFSLPSRRTWPYKQNPFFPPSPTRSSPATPL